MPDKEPALRSVTIAFDVLDAFFVDAELSLSELARRVGVTKSTMHRMCGVLAGRGVLEKTEAGKYRLGMRLVEFGQLVTSQSALRSQALPLLVELRNAIGETIQLGVPAGGDIQYIERVEGLGALRIGINSTRRSPVHRSSTGKALAAFRTDVAATRLREGLKPFTGHTIVVPKLFAEELERIRQQGYAISRDESEIGLSSIGVPVREAPGGTVIAAIGAAGPTARVLGGRERHNIQLLRRAAEQLTDALTSGAYKMPS